MTAINHFGLDLKDNKRHSPLLLRVSSSVLALCILCACTPRVEVMAPEKPIEINLNIKITQELRITLEKDVDELLDNSEGLY